MNKNSYPPSRNKNIQSASEIASPAPSTNLIWSSDTDRITTHEHRRAVWEKEAATEASDHENRRETAFKENY